MKRALVFQHADCEGPALIGEWLLENGWAIEIFNLHSQNTLPNLAHFHFLVIMGGAMNVYQHRDYPWLVWEKEFIARAVAAKLPVLGICLGAQLLADTLGSRVYQNKDYEIGWWPVSFTAQAQELFPGLPSQAVFLHWHGDTFSCPQNAVPLASSAACPMQGFLWENHVLALQFHPEADAALAQEFCKDPSNWPKGSWVQSPEQIKSTAAAHSAISKKYLGVILSGFFSRLEVCDDIPPTALEI
jgi:GMP synthase (glutamine-hydrolysing)